MVRRGAIGSAFVVYHGLGGERTYVMDHAYWGPAFDAMDISHPLATHQSLAAACCTLKHISDEATLCRRTASAIADGKVVRWFQGRVEWSAGAWRPLDRWRPAPCYKESHFGRSRLQFLRRPWQSGEAEDAMPFMVFQIHEEKTKCYPCRHTRRRLRPIANSILPHQLQISPAD